MNGIATIGTPMALPATRVLRLTGDRPVSRMEHAEADEVILAAVRHPPRIGEARPIAALMPEVLARYGIGEETGRSDITCDGSVDLIA